MKMSRAYTKDNLLSTFPYALTQSKKQNALADATARELEKLYEQNRLADIYTRIDELDEVLCDILAYDYKIDWYMWDATLEAKRALVKSHFYIHRHMGTRGAVEAALSAVCPGTQVEEWFEYGGKPYYFRVVVDVSEQRTPIRQREMERMIRIFKDVRSLLETNKITIRSRCGIIVSCDGNYVLYSTRPTGVYPYAAVQGYRYSFPIEVNADDGMIHFSTPITNQVIAGTAPRPAMQGYIYENGIDVLGVGIDNQYPIPEAKDYPAGTYPVIAKAGGLNRETIDVDAAAVETSYAATATGTKPYPAEKGGISKEVISTLAEGIDSNYAIDPTGTKPYSAEQGRIYVETVDIAAAPDDASYHIVASGKDVPTGTIPRSSVSGETRGSDISFGTKGDSAGFNARYCGTSFDNPLK